MDNNKKICLKNITTKSFLPLFRYAQTKCYLSIKIKINDEEGMQWTLFSLTDSLGLVTTSEEIFYRVPKGQLKIRFAHPGKDIGELISISVQNPIDNDKSMGKFVHLFEARTSTLKEAGQFRHTLGLCLEELAIIRKKRKTYILGSVNFHLDIVDGLGTFLDIEIHPKENNDKIDENKLFCKARELLQRLNVSTNTLLPYSSYLELFLKGEEKREESDESAFSDESVAP
ncbi:hypothetical protein ACQ4LE_008333 [Meloidogyne hapla]|uniref:CYTH domain-containing protein n=1 Tax=Meloidogyne hapla TaxID=6305 RepID=A0A1I8BDP6_MELHA